MEGARWSLRLACKGSEVFWGPHREFGRERVLPSLVEDKPCSVFQRNESVRRDFLILPQHSEVRGGVPFRTGFRLTLPRYFVAVRPEYFETHKLIALQATDQNRVFIPTIKANNDYYRLAQREKLF